MPDKTPNISPAELKVLQILWESSPLCAQQIIGQLKNIPPWSDRTIKSLINRLLKKKAIHYHQDANRYFYYPLLKKNDYLNLTTHFLHRLLGGRISPLIAHFAAQAKISKEEIKELKTIIEELESDD